MKKIPLWLAAVVFALAFTITVAPLAQQAGGAFVPNADYTVTGAWTFGSAPTITGGGSVVSTTATQTLTNKTLTSPTISGATLTTPAIGAATGTSLAVTGAITSSGAASGIGYATGAGCAVTQATNRSTGVTCTGMSGAITTDATSLAAGAEATFTVTNTSVAVGDTVIVSARSGQTAGTSIPFVTTVAAGSFNITLSNVHASTADTGAMIINFAVIKAVGS